MARDTNTKPVEKIDPVWDRIRTEAEEAVRIEPALGGFIYSSLLAHDSFEAALIHRLAQRLGSADLGSDTIVNAFEDAITAEPEIGLSARADLTATFDRDPACHRYIDPFLYFKGYQALQTHRMAHRLWSMGRKDFAYFLQQVPGCYFGFGSGDIKSLHDPGYDFNDAALVPGVAFWARIVEAALPAQ